MVARLPRWAIALTLAGSIFTVYATALQSGFFWDDFDFARPITLGEWLFTFRGTWNWTGIGNDYYRPLIVTLFQIDYHLYGLRPAGFHLTNILLHILNSTLVAWFLARWVRKRWALAGAVFFALHPMAATGLAWISERTDVLATTFFLLALLAMSSYLRPGESSGLAPVGAAYAGALASKEVAITFPAVALAYAACRQRFNRKCIRIIMFLAGMSAIYAIGWVVLFHEKLGAVNITTVASESSFIQFWHSLLRLLTFAFIPTYYPSYDFEFLGGESLTYFICGQRIFRRVGARALCPRASPGKMAFRFSVGVASRHRHPSVQHPLPRLHAPGLSPGSGIWLGGCGRICFRLPLLESRRKMARGSTSPHLGCPDGPCRSTHHRRLGPLGANCPNDQSGQSDRSEMARAHWARTPGYLLGATRAPTRRKRTRGADHHFGSDGQVTINQTNS